MKHVNPIPLGEQAEPSEILRNAMWDIESHNRAIYSLAKQISENAKFAEDRHTALIVMHLSTVLSDCWDSFNYD